MRERILIAGSGGQGVVLLGRLLAAVALPAVPHITFFPTYGAEVRGGACYCQVLLSSAEIASPVVDRFDFLLLMNQATVNQFLPRRAVSGIAIVNSSLCTVAPAPRIVAIPATALADSMGDARAANFIMLGALLALKPLVPVALVEQTIPQLLTGCPQPLLMLNLRAFRAGLQHATTAGASAH